MVIFFIFCVLKIALTEKEEKNKHNAELQRADPGTEVTGQFSTRGRIFLHDAQNGFSLFSSF